MNKTKLCKKCGQFPKHKKRPLCHECEKERLRISAREMRKDPIKKVKIEESNKRYKERNREKILKKYRDYHYRNKQKHNEKSRLYREKHKEENAQRNKEWRNTNRDHVRDYGRRYRSAKLKSDSRFRLLVNLRRRLSLAFGGRKDKRTEVLLGCSIEELWNYLGPTPEKDCHLDHICPFAQAHSKEEIEKLCHFTNLRWLPASENMRKNACKTPEAEQKCIELLGRGWIE